MFQPLQTGRLGLTGQQRSVDVIGNNIANINTTGFKKARLDFQDNLYTRMYNKEDMGPHMNLQRGVGTRVYQTARMFEQGAMQSTGRPLDFGLQGRGFFVLRNPEPIDDEEYLDEFLYTRSGAFYLSVEIDEGLGNPNEAFLVDAVGRYVLDVDGNPIAITDATNLQCDPHGVLYYSDADGVRVDIAQLGLVDFSNPAGLQAIGDNVFMQTVNSGELELEPVLTVRQGFVEESNVDLAEEMTRMIRAQRAYQLAARCVTTADQMMQIANAIRS